MGAHIAGQLARDGHRGRGPGHSGEVAHMAMTPDVDALELLVLWWRAESQWTPVEGYPHECPSTAGWRASRQYDFGQDSNGAGETDARGHLIRHISSIVASIEEPYRTALYLVARNRALGVSVWRSARLPQDQDERAEIVAEAVERFSALVGH